MGAWTEALVDIKFSVRETIQTIDKSALQIALVVDQQKRLLGTVTDGDVRRGILRGIAVEEPVTKIMNSSPLVLRVGENRAPIINQAKALKLRHLPLVDDKNVIQDLIFVYGAEPDVNAEITPKDNLVVLMAGGLGLRLRPLTDKTPKPLLKVGEKPIIEIILNNFIKHGFRNFHISVNYKGDMIKDYFKDGSKWGVSIRYLDEKKRLGTAGALGLIQKKPKAPFIVMNADVLTNVDFSLLLDYHLSLNNSATMCVREFDYQIPYGVVRLEKNKIVGIEEKPIMRSFVSAGIYVLNPDVFRYIPKNEYYDMPTLFEDLIRENHVTSVFPIREYWRDIGQIDDYRQANMDFEEVFG